MTLIDTSAWIEYLRNTGSPVCESVEDLLTEDISICEAVEMEVLAGARDDGHLRDLRRLLAKAVMLRIRPTDYEDAATLYRRCRQRGETVRKMIVCLIASVAIRTDTPILHNDIDFEVLARQTELQVHEPRH